MKLNIKRTSTISINGRTFSGKDVSITNGRVIVDGVEQDGESLPQIVHVQLIGDAEKIETGEGTVTVSGSVGQISTMSGDVHSGDVSGSINTMSGDVDCGTVAGSVSAMSGDITHSK